MLDISLRSELPDKAIVYLDGLDARIFRKLLSALQSEEKVQNAIILCGLLQAVKEMDAPPANLSEAEIEASFSEFVGITFSEFVAILEKD